MTTQKFNGIRSAINQGMKQVLINDVNEGLRNGTIVLTGNGFTTPEGFLYTNAKKGNLLFTLSVDGTLYQVAKYVTNEELKEKIVEEKLSTNIKVSHSKFGNGYIVETIENMVKVIFDTVGEKNMNLSFANLTFIS